MIVDVETEIVIRCPRELVAGYSSNPDNTPEWYVNIREVEWESAPPLTLGSKIAFVAQDCRIAGLNYWPAIPH